ncbi:MAG: helix-turn-helix domain-containing protein [Actinobacteria bacterium]|nr:helix-turn-helix domain-containing protein [Actinomycetota bacterium]
MTIGDLVLQLTDEQAEDARRQLGVAAPKSDHHEDVLTTAEVAPILGCSAKYVRELCRLPKSDRRYLKHARKGREILIRREDAADWVARQIEE